MSFSTMKNSVLDLSSQTEFSSDTRGVMAPLCGSEGTVAGLPGGTAAARKQQEASERPERKLKWRARSCAWLRGSGLRSSLIIPRTPGGVSPRPFLTESGFIT